MGFSREEWLQNAGCKRVVQQNAEVVCHCLLQWTYFVRTLHHDLPVLGGPTQHGSQFVELGKGVIHRNQFG